MLDTSASLAPKLALTGAAPAVAPAVARADGAAAVDFSAVLAGAALSIDLGEAPEAPPPPPVDQSLALAANAGRSGIVGNRPGKILPPGKQPAEPEIAAEDQPDSKPDADLPPGEQRDVAGDAVALLVQDRPAPLEQPAHIARPLDPAIATSAPAPAQEAAKATLARSEDRPSRDRPAPKTGTATPLVSAAPLVRTAASTRTVSTETIPQAPALQMDVAPTRTPQASATGEHVPPSLQGALPVASQLLPLATATLLQPALVLPASTTNTVKLDADVSLGLTQRAGRQASPVQSDAAAARPSAREQTPALAQALLVPAAMALAPAPGVLAGRAAPQPSAPAAQPVPATDPVAPNAQTLAAPQDAATDTIAKATSLAPAPVASVASKAEVAAAPTLVAPVQNPAPVARVDTAVGQATADALPVPVQTELVVREKADTLHATMSLRATAAAEAGLPAVQPSASDSLMASMPTTTDARPALVAAPGPSSATSAGQDIASLVDRIVEARAAAAPDTIRASLVHEEFGSVSLSLRTDASHIHVTLGSADPTFAPAAHAAAASLANNAGAGQDERREQAAHQPQQQPGHDAGAPNAQTSQQHQSARNSASTSERVSPRDSGQNRDGPEQAQPSQIAPDRRSGIYA
jgi:hypothetical protein